MPTAHGSAASQRLGSLIHQLRSVAGPTPADLVDVDLPRHQLRALFIVVQHGPMAVGDLAEATGASLASASSLADRLVRAGYLRRKADPSDRRRVMLTGTPKGHTAIEQVTARFHARFERLVEAMSPSGRNALEVGLADMISTAEQLGLNPSEHHHPHGGER